MEKLKALISGKMTIKWDEDVNSLVGIQIRKTAEGYRLQQPLLIHKLLKEDESGMTAATPLADTSLEYNEATTPDTAYLS
ncbi:hypothetical protein VP01_5690g1 [Puccinia sorghi]|uniref:Uncharacterized protein n=1 Tax=Puccinia sorghi TaxID=27349 RepID=A0A0L6UKT3_9BASI|nr:hypothetical protein VP01_5690g1 [Puccinia sorghi]